MSETVNLAKLNMKKTVERARCVNTDCQHAATSHVLIYMTRNHYDESGRGACRYSRCPCVYYRPKGKI